MRVAIVGGGIMGVATAAAIARRGHDVDLYEQYDLDHGRGSSHGASRIFRLAYSEREWVELAKESLNRWRELERETGEQLLLLDGLLEFGAAPTDALEQCGVAWEPVEPPEVEERFGVHADVTAAYHPTAGVAFAARARQAFAAIARDHGARIFERTQVSSLRDVDGDTVVVTAGAWARTLLDACGIELPVVVTRETVGYFHYAPRAPAVIDYDHQPAAAYALHDPVYGLKAGIHHAGDVADPDDPREPSAGLAASVSEWVARRFPAADPIPAALETCLYTTTPDRRFVLERHGRFVVGSACSGHGFKFAPVVAERLAALAEG